ncbi:MAG TPA: DUF4238 domain-containing protein [Chitinophagales bacterium]|nr:DUF4238 domain-containing protein [Chitinophagales bacterium]
MPNNEPIRQHYVPRAYLKNFAEWRSNEYYIHALPVADFKDDAIRSVNIRNVCLEKNLYTLAGETEEDRLIIERFYGQKFENHYGEFYGLLTDESKKNASESERRLIVSTVISMLCRTPHDLNNFNKSWDKVIEMIYTNCEELGTDEFEFQGHKMSIAGQTMEETKKNNKVLGKQTNVIKQLQNALNLIELRIQRDGLYVSRLDENYEFISSDNPVTMESGAISSDLFNPNHILSLPIDTKHRLSLLPIAKETTKGMIVRNYSSKTDSHSEALVANNTQDKGAERFLLGSENGLRHYYNMVQPYANANNTTM